MTLAGLVSGLRARDLLPAIPGRRPTSTQAAGTALAELFATTADIPQGEDLAALAARIRRALDEHRVDRLARRDWRMLPYCLWLGAPPLVGHAGMLPALEHELQRPRGRKLLRNLLSAYLDHFSASDPHTAVVARLIEQNKDKLDDDWRQRLETYKLIIPERAPETLFAACIRHELPDTVLADAGIGPNQHRGIIDAVLRTGTQAVERGLAAGRTSAKAMDFLETTIFQPGGIAAPQLRRALAEAYLRPWSNGDPTDGRLKQRIQDFMLRYYGDPRSRPQNWTGVGDDAKAVMRRWLVKVVLDQFLDVIDDLAFENHWMFRRAFWMGYFRQGWIEEADVLFGSTCMVVARRLFGKDAPCIPLETGYKLVEPRHAVLLMRIGRLIIADWSHNGRCVIWPDNSPTAPKFGKPAYSSTDVYPRGRDWALSHQGSYSYSWQQRLRDKISEETGLYLANEKFKI